MFTWFRPSGFSNGNGMDGVQLPRSSKIRTLHGEIEALFSTGFGYDKPYERISRESLAGAVCQQAA